MKLLRIEKENDAWILHRERMGRDPEGEIYGFFLLDAYSGYCFKQRVCLGELAKTEMSLILSEALEESEQSPNFVLVAQDDPILQTLREVCDECELHMLDVAAEDLESYLAYFKQSIAVFNKNLGLSEQAESSDKNSLRPAAYEGDFAFEIFLLENELPLSVWEMKAYLLGLLVGPDMITPTFAIDEILLVDTKHEVQFSSDEQAQQFMVFFIGLWNHLADEISSPKSGFPSLSPIPQPLEEDDCLPALDSRRVEVDSFLAGLYESGVGDLAKSQKDLDAAMDELQFMFDLLDDRIEDLQELNTSSEKIELTLNSLEEFDQSWNKSFQTILKSLREEDK